MKPIRPSLLCLLLVMTGVSASADNCPYINDSELGALCIADGFISCHMQNRMEVQRRMVWDYVMARESYDPAQFATHWRNIQTYSSEKIFADFKDAFKPELMTHRVTLDPSAPDASHMTVLPIERCDRYGMEVSFTRRIQMKKGITSEKKTVRVYYVFLQTSDDIPYSDSNPSGFKVLAYQQGDRGKK
jgi:type IV secretory pathway component VirB8